MMAVATIIVLPIVIVFFLAQNLFVKGIVMTGIKGVVQYDIYSLP